MSKRVNASGEEDEESSCHKKLKINEDDNFSSDRNDIITEDVTADSIKLGNNDTGETPLSINHISEEGGDINETTVNLLDLPDDVLLILMKNLHPFDLLRLSRTCNRLNGLSHDRSLWIDVDFRHDEDDKTYTETTVDFDDFIDFLLPITRSIKKSGTGIKVYELACSSLKTTQSSITPAFMEKVIDKVTALKSFALENHTIFGPLVTLECFPSTLEYLSFKDSLIVRLPTDRSYFHKIDKILPNLTILNLSGCQWFGAHSFLALSKSNTLKELHLKGCRGIEDCVPYASLAATFGFPALELLDLRWTFVNDSDISCFNRVEKLKKLYLEALVEDSSCGRNRISDIGVTSFGGERVVNANVLDANPVGLAFVLIQNHRPVRSSLETLVLRNYRTITDISLKHAAGCLPNLKHLDVRGTCCTLNGVNDFKYRRPEVELLTDFSNNLSDEIPAVVTPCASSHTCEQPQINKNIKKE